MNARRSKHLFCLLTILASICCEAQDTTKILFIGNSFMAVNDLPSLFSQLAQGSGKQVVVASRMPGGCSVGDTIQGTFARMYSPEVYALIKSNEWDYLFLQDRQSRFALSRGVFPGDSKVIEGHIKIRDSLLYFHPCAHMLWFAGFGLKNGMPPYSTTGAGMIDSIYQNYKYLEDSAGQVIVPIGPAYLRIIAGYPSIDLWGPDEEHPSLQGSLMIASVLYATVFKSSPIASIYNPGIQDDEDSILKTTAYQTTLDSLDFSGLSGITPPAFQAGDSLWVNGYQVCSWFFNGQPYPADQCVAHISQNGNYYALATDANGCRYRTLEKQYKVNTGTNDQKPGNGLFVVFPDPASYRISVSFNISLEKMSILNASGTILQEIPNPCNPAEIDISFLPEGLYIILGIDRRGGSKSVKFIKE
jgi:hypothetical protein